MSRHVVDKTEDARKYVFGWDQSLQSYFLQVHHLDAPEDDQIQVWLGADKDTQLYELEDFIREARKHGLTVNHDLRRQLYKDRDEGL